MTNAARRALAITVGASLLILTAGSGPALAAKSTKTANARPALSSLISQTRPPAAAGSSSG